MLLGQNTKLLKHVWGSMEIKSHLLDLLFINRGWQGAMSDGKESGGGEWGSGVPGFRLQRLHSTHSCLTFTQNYGTAWSSDGFADGTGARERGECRVAQLFKKTPSRWTA